MSERLQNYLLATELKKPGIKPQQAMQVRSQVKKIPDLESSFTEELENTYRDVELGCDEYLTIIINQDFVPQRFLGIQMDKTVKFSYVSTNTFRKFLDKIKSSVITNGIGKWSLMQDPEQCAMLFLICRERTFKLSSYFLIRNPPIKNEEWILGAGLVSFYEGQGYGKRMLVAAEKVGKLFGTTSIILESTPESYSYYLRNGYKDIDGKNVRKLL